MNALRGKLARGQRCFGTHINLADHRICEMLGPLGFDYLWIDTEHTSTDYQELEIHLIAARAGGTPAIVRIPWNDATLAKRVLEMGPDGIIFPMVNNAQEAKRAMDACLYPPLGTRGFGPLRAIRYGLDDVDTFIQEKSLDMLRFVQVETKEAVENLADMAAVPYVDGFILGPCDLSGSIGAPNRFLDGMADRLIDQAIVYAHRASKPIGVSTGTSDPAVLRHWLDKGIDFLSASTDMSGIITGAHNVLSAMREINARK